jgi:CRP/FNR family transcriptional regulator
MLEMPGKSSLEIKGQLKALPYFRKLDTASIQAVTEVAIRRSYDPNEIILLEGEPATGLFIIQEGWIKVSKISLDGREQILQFLGSGEVFNGISVFTDTPNPATATALEPSTVWLIPKQRMLDLLESHPPLARAIIQDLAGRVQHLITLVEDLSLRKVESRFARLLIEEAVDNNIQRKHWGTQAEIAARLGTVSDVISRTVRKFIEQRILEVTRNEITILDREKLANIASLSETQAMKDL